MSKTLKWLEEESYRLEKECNENSNLYKTVNNSFLEGFNYALANIRELEETESNKVLAAFSQWGLEQEEEE